MTKRQFIVAIALVSALALGVAALFFGFFDGSSEEENVIETVELSAEEVAEIEIFSSTFLQEASSFGINMDTLTSETVSQRMQDIANDNGGTSWTKRSEVASRLANEHMDLSGGFPFALERIANADFTDGNRVAGFRAGAMELQPEPTADYVYTDRSEPVLLAKVPFSGSSTLSHFSQSSTALAAGAPSDAPENHDAESTPWDVREQSIAVEGVLTLSREDGGNWRVRDITFETGEFAMPFWSPEPFTTNYPDTELGGTVVRTVDFPNQMEMNDAQG